MDTWTQAGIKIQCNDRGRFETDGLDNTFERLSEARAAADSLSKRIRESAKVRLNIPFVSDTGESGVITGFHSATGGVLTTGFKVPKYGEIHRLMPPEATAAVSAYIAAKARFDALYAYLIAVSIEIPTGTNIAAFVQEVEKNSESAKKRFDKLGDYESYVAEQLKNKTGKP